MLAFTKSLEGIDANSNLKKKKGMVVAAMPLCPIEG